MSENTWKGWLRKGEVAGTVTGELVDSWGWRVQLFGTFDESGRQYVLTGSLGKPPAGLVIEAIDSETGPRE